LYRELYIYTERAKGVNKKKIAAGRFRRRGSLPSRFVCRNSDLGKSLRGAGFGAAALPFVIFAEAGLVFFDLRFDVMEGFFAAGAHVFVACGGLERAGGKREIQRECVFLGAGDFAKYCVKRNEIGLITFQEYIQFGYGSFKLLVDGIVTLDIFETDGEFHMRTCEMFEG